MLISYKQSVIKTEVWPDKIYHLNDTSKIEELTFLGKVLFYDPVLSLDSSTSCSSCHSPYNAFSHTDHSLSHGIDNKIVKKSIPNTHSNVRLTTGYRSVFANKSR